MRQRLRHPSPLNPLAAAALAAALLGGVPVTTALLPSTVQAQEAVRPEVGKPLQAAQELIRARKFKEALAKVREADAVGGKTANENFLIERMRLAAASGAGDADTAAKSYEAIAGKLGGADKLRILESLAGTYYRAQQYGKAMQWGQRYFKEGGNSAAIRTLLIQSQYLSGDFAGAARELTTEIQQAEKAGQAPGEDRLKLLMNATLKLNDTNGYVWAVEKLVTYYPKKEYWVDLLSRLQRKPNFSDRLVLDAYRLSLATGSMSPSARPPEAGLIPSGDRLRYPAGEGPTDRRTNDYMEMAQLALQAGYPAEAKQVVDKGFAAGVLGQGAEAERHQRLQALVLKRVEEDKAARAERIAQAQAAKDGSDLLSAGMNLVFAGESAEGLKLMQQGLAKGRLKREDDAKLHYGIAQVIAGQNGKALSTLRSVAGKDGTADLARLWVLYARRKG